MTEQNLDTQTPQEQIQPTEKKKRSVNGWLIAVIVLLLAALGGTIWHFSHRDNRYRADSRAVAGYIKNRSAEEIQSLLNQVVEEGMLNVSMNSHVTVNSRREGDVCIENIEANHYLMRVDIIITDSEGQQVTVYESGTIAPGYCIEYGKFSVMPPEGVVDAVAVFTALDQDTLEAVGQVKLNIIVETEA